MRDILLLLAALTVSASTDQVPPVTDLVVHEWGTLTSIAGEDGLPVEWLPLTGQSDLPCFVERSSFTVKGSIAGTVRMETPVLYFYAPRETAVAVNVRFPNGVVTEWFPHAAVAQSNVPLRSGSASRIRWPHVLVRPGAAEHFQAENALSHYYTARQTSANPLRVGGSDEKFLFYRGVGNFALPIAATVDGADTVTIRRLDRDDVGDVILFTNHGGRMAYEVRRIVGGQESIEPRATDAIPAAELERMLLDAGMFADEAAAMIDTWRDSWFEEGTRLFYVVPRAAIDAVLPLDITPTPTGIARAFVGRMELLTNDEAREINGALDTNDGETLQKYGRFLYAFARRLGRPVLAPPVLAASSEPGDQTPRTRLDVTRPVYSR